MVRSLRRRGARRNGLRVTADVLPVAEVTDVRVLRLPRVGIARRHEGWMIEASVLARLLKIRLLRLEARIALVPTTVAESIDYQADFTRFEPRRRAPDAGSLHDARELLAKATDTLHELPRA
jgi:hypothetical protein